MKEKEFSLLQEPWILALDEDGQTCQLSLMQVFAQAHRLHDLAGEMAAQDAAVIRVLLAVLYAVFGWEDVNGQEGTPQSIGEAQQRWQKLWQLGHFPMQPIETYLNTWQEQFYLFHPVTPFMQVTVDPEAKVMVNGKPLPINPLVKSVSGFIGDLAESSNKAALFSYRQDKDSLSYAEAARWLIHLNSYDVSPLGAPPQGCFRAKGFKIPWPNNLGMVWAKGQNLFETLMLNFVLAPSGGDLWAEFRPVWESDEAFDPQSLTETQAPFPQDPAALFTFPFRRLQLKRSQEDKVTGCILWGGLLVEATGGNPLTETMTLWRMAPDGSLLPKKHDPSRQMWQDFGALLSAAQGRPPGVVQWLSSLTNQGMLHLSLLQLNIAGVVLSSKSTSVDDAFWDGLRFHTSLLMDLKEGWPARITTEVEVTEKLVRQTGYLAANLVKAAGGSGEQDSKEATAKARREAYFLLNSPFRQWLESIDESTSMEAGCAAWRNIQAQLFQSLGKQMAQRAGSKALVGRMLKDHPNDTKGRVYTSPALYQRYLWQIKQILSA